MLERAAGCFESAGRRFLRDTDGILRTRRSLARHFWKHNVVVGNISSWLPALLQVSDSTASSVLNPFHGHNSINDTCLPFLDFLYPRQARELATSKLFRHSRRLGLRRRTRSFGGRSKGYSTQATTNLEKILLEQSNAPPPEEEKIDVPRQARRDLGILLRMDGEEFDNVWVLYVAAGRPEKFRRRLCKYLSKSTQASGRHHAWQVFQEIPQEIRRFQDFRRITRSQLSSKEPCFARMKSICVDAISMGLGALPCAYAFEYYAKSADWIKALEIWDLRSRLAAEDDKQHLESFFWRINRSTLAGIAYDLGNFLAASPHCDSARALAETMLGKISTSPSVLANSPMDILLRFIEKYLELGVFKETHYFGMIQTLQASDSRQIFIRSMLLYRHLRRNLPDTKPPTKLLNGQLASLKKFEITDGVHFFINEFAQFWGKPSIEAYKHALVLFSRTADVQEVNAIFARLVADHGKPRSRRLLTPLLAVHARNGNAQEAIAQFRRISEEFHLRPNTECWNILLKAYAARDDAAGALRTYVQMADSGVPPDAYTFGTLMGISANRGDIDGTRWLLKEAQKRSVKVTMPMLDTIAQTYCLNRRPDLAEQLARAAGRKKIKGSATRMWNMVLFQYALRMDRVGWLRARDYMAKNKITPDAMTLAARLLMSALKNRPEEVRAYLRRLHKSRTIHATVMHYSILLLAYLRTRNRPMVRIILNEALERFGNTMSASSLARLMAHVDHDLELVQKGVSPDVHDAHLRLEDTEKSLVLSFGRFHGTVLADKFSFLNGDGKSASSGLSTSQYEFLVNHYGTRGSIQEAKEMFNKYLESRATVISPHDEASIIPFRIITVMMRAHMAAEEFDKVEEFWSLALSNAIKAAQPLRLDQFFASPAPESSKTVGSGSLPEPLSEFADGPVNLDSPSSEHPAPHNQPSVRSSKRFVLSQPFSIYIRALAYQNKTDEISQAVNQLEAAGFEMSGTNWSTYVQMKAASDRQADVVEAFQVFERKLTPNFPGWGPLKRGWALKPETASGTTHLLEFDTLHYAHTQRQKHGSFLGRQARKHWRKIEPGLLTPTYVTTVYLAAALNRVRAASIAAGTTDLMTIYDAAPKTVQMIGELPHLRDKPQGALLRGAEPRPDLTLPVHDRTIAFGGALGKGARARFNWDLRHPRIVGRSPQDGQRSDVDQPIEEPEQPQSQQPLEDQQPLEGQQPMQGAQLAEPFTDGQWDLHDAEGRKRWPRFPYLEPTRDNETVRLLAHILSPENSTSAGESYLSHEDRLDIESDIRFLATMRSLEQARRLADERERVHREALASARKTRSRRPSSLIDFYEEGEGEDGFEAELEELRRLGELQPQDQHGFDKATKFDESDHEDSEDLFNDHDESDFEDSPFQENADLLDGSDVQESEQVRATTEPDFAELGEPGEKIQHPDSVAIVDWARNNERQFEAKREDAETSPNPDGKMH